MGVVRVFVVAQAKPDDHAGRRGRGMRFFAHQHDLPTLFGPMAACEDEVRESARDLELRGGGGGGSGGKRWLLQG